MSNQDIKEKPEKTNHVERNEWLDAGSIEPSCKRYVVTYPHGHKYLKAGDVVVMVENPYADNYLLRESDMTLHHLRGQSDQYIHLVEVKGSNV